VNADLVTLIRDIYQTSEFIPLYAPTFGGNEKEYVGNTLTGHLSPVSVNTSIKLNGMLNSALVNLNRVLLFEDFMARCARSQNPYGKGGSSVKTVEELIVADLRHVLHKSFYNVAFES
jgi:hypothetical protein